MTTSRARQIVLAARPKGKPDLTDFRLEETAIATPASGQLLLEVQYCTTWKACRWPRWQAPGGSRWRRQSRVRTAPGCFCADVYRCSWTAWARLRHQDVDDRRTCLKMSGRRDQER